MSKKNPFRPADDDARDLARSLIDGARFGALGVSTRETGAPIVSRIAVATDPDGLPLTAISELSHHTKALRDNPICSLMVGEPGPKGDPLTHPRLTIQAHAEFLSRDAPDFAALRTRFLSQIPKAKLYIDFADFSLVRFVPTGAYLNGGFGKAYVLAPEDLAPAQ